MDEIIGKQMITIENKEVKNELDNDRLSIDTPPEPVETEEQKTEKAFEQELEKILDKIKALPSEAEELRIPKANKDITEVYKKLCKALKVPENSTFLNLTKEEKMDFSYQCLGPVGIIPVTKALTLPNEVKILDLKYNNLGVESLPAITSLLDQNEDIAHLNLAGNEIGKGSANMLSEVIARCFSVEYLDLSNNNLGDEELQEIGLALMKIDCVKELILSANDFSSAKAPPFGFFISKCSALLKLDMSCCHLEEGAANIFGGLKISNLKYLNLARNGIPDEATQALATGLRTNKSLQELDVSYNCITNKGATTLASGLKGSSTLEVMRLAHNPIDGSATATLLSSAGSNLKLLDLSGVRVNLAFFKTLRTYNKSGRDIQVLFGPEIRYDCFPRDLTAPDESSLTKDNVLTYLECLAEEKGVSLRNTLKNIHANFIAEQQAALAGEQDADKAKDDNTKRPEMTTENLAKALATSAIAVPKAVVLEVAELLSEDGFVNMWNLIARVRWKPDDLKVKVKGPKKEPAEKPKDKKKK